jgi:MFS family permease
MSNSDNMHTTNRRSRIRRGWVVLAVGLVVMASGCALRNSFSVFYPAIVEDFGWSRGSTAIMYSLGILVCGLLSPLVGGLVDRFRPQFVLALGFCVLCSSIAMCGLATREWQFYVLFGVLAAVGGSLTGITPVAAIVIPWFERNRGLVFGVLAAGFGGSLVAASLVQFLISTYGWQSAFVISGLSVAGLMVPLTLVLVRRAPRARPLPVETESSRKIVASGPSDWHSSAWTLRRALRTPQFWMLWLAGFCQVGVGEKVAIAHQVYFFRDAGYSPAAAASIYSVFGIVFVGGNLASLLSDRLGREKVYVPACALSIGAACMLFGIRDASQPWMAYLFAALFGAGTGAMPPVMFASIADLFHGMSYGAIMGMTVLGISIGGALSPWLAGHLHDVSNSYTSTLYILVAALVVSGLMVWLAAPRRLNPVRPYDGR